MDTRIQNVYTWIFAGSVLIALGAADRGMKWYAVRHLHDEIITILPSWLDLTYVPNPRILYVLDFSPWVMIALVSVIISVMVGVSILSVLHKEWWRVFFCAVLLLGAYSNLIDRVWYEAVIDMIRIPEWTVFNLADLYIVIGAVGIAVTTSDWFRARHEKKLRQRHSAETPLSE